MVGLGPADLQNPEFDQGMENLVGGALGNIQGLADIGAGQLLLRGGDEMQYLDGSDCRSICVH
jgi:hypothetical protein